MADRRGIPAAHNGPLEVGCANTIGNKAQLFSDACLPARPRVFLLDAATGLAGNGAICCGANVALGQDAVSAYFDRFGNRVGVLVWQIIVPPIDRSRAACYRCARTRCSGQCRACLNPNLRIACRLKAYSRI